MSRRHSSVRSGIAVAVLVAALGTACGTGSDQGGSVTVTLSRTVVASPSSSATVTIPASPSIDSSTEVTVNTPETTAEASATSALTSTTTSRTSASPSSTPEAVWVVQQAADPTVPGPEGGPPCPVDKKNFDEPATGLRADVAAGWAAAKAKAAVEGVTLCLNDGKRSRAQQLAEFNAYVKAYGTAVAKQYVLPPEKSAHVAGYAVDVQPAKAYQWLQGTRGALGFCRRYDNEAWHFEYAVQYKTTGCPPREPKPVG